MYFLNRLLHTLLLVAFLGCTATGPWIQSNHQTTEQAAPTTPGDSPVVQEGSAPPEQPASPVESSLPSEQSQKSFWQRIKAKFASQPLVAQVIEGVVVGTGVTFLGYKALSSFCKRKEVELVPTAGGRQIIESSGWFFRENNCYYDFIILGSHQSIKNMHLVPFNSYDGIFKDVTQYAVENCPKKKGLILLQRPSPSVDDASQVYAWFHNLSGMKIHHEQVLQCDWVTEYPEGNGDDLKSILRNPFRSLSGGRSEKKAVFGHMRTFLYSGQEALKDVPMFMRNDRN